MRILTPFVFLLVIIATTAVEWTIQDIHNENLKYAAKKTTMVDEMALTYLGFNQLSRKHVESPETRYRKWKSHIASRKYFTAEYDYQTLQLRISQTEEPHRADAAVRQVRLDAPRARHLFFQSVVLYPNTRKARDLVIVQDPAELVNSYVDTLTDFLVTYCYGPASMVRASSDYVQGMHAIAATLLLALDQDQDKAMRIFVTILNEYGFYDMLDNDLHGVHVRLRVLDELVLKRLPNLHAHFTAIGVQVHMFAYPWLMTLFQNEISLFPETRVRIMDGFIKHQWRMIYALSITILRRLEADLLTLPFDTIVQRINEFSSHITPQRELLGLQGVAKELEAITEKRIQNLEAKHQL